MMLLDSRIFLELLMIQVCFSSSEPAKSPKCGYLKSSDVQFNAYFEGNLLCCMCGIGTSLEEDCNESHPNTTVCKKCHFSHSDPHNRYFIHFEPHVQRHCFRQPILHCQSPKVLFEGSTTEEARCICPPSMEEVPDSENCIKNQSTSTDSRLLSKILQNNSSENKHAPDTSLPQAVPGSVVVTTMIPISPTTSALRTMVSNSDGPVEVAGPDVTQDVTISDRNLTNPAVKEKATPHALIWPFVGLALLVMVFVAVLWCQCHRKKPEPLKPDPSAEDLRKVSYVELPHEETPADSSMESIELSKSDATSKHCETYVAEFVPGEDCAGPLNDVLGDRPEQGPQAEHCMDGRQVMETYKRFAEKVARRMETEVRADDLRMVFRTLINDGVKSDNDIEDIIDQYRKTSERIWQLMRLAWQKKGMDLSPEYIRERFSTLECRNLVDIVEQEMRV